MPPSVPTCAKIFRYFGGAVAQLGARLDGIEEVVGSNPIGSTNFSILFSGADSTVSANVGPLRETL